MKNITNKSRRVRMSKKIVAYICSFSLIMMCFSFPITITAEVAQAKISSDLLQKMNVSADGKSFPVIVWVNDVQYEEQSVAAQVNAAVSAMKDTTSAFNTSLSKK